MFSFITDLKIKKHLNHLTNNDSSVRRSAAVALGVMRDVRFVEPLISVLNDENKSVQDEAMKALGMIGDTRAIIPLINANAKLDVEIYTLAQVLKQFGEPAVEALIIEVKNNDITKRKKAATLLKTIGRIPSVQVDYIHYLVASDLWWEIEKMANQPSKS